MGNLVGNFTELRELMTLAGEGKVRLTTRVYPLREINQAMHDLAAGRLTGRAVLVP